MPGSNLIFKENRIIIDKYWNIKLSKNRLSFNENVEKFKEYLFPHYYKKII